jgi:hypothetical protein
MSPRRRRRAPLAVAAIGLLMLVALCALLTQGAGTAEGSEGGWQEVAAHFSVLGEATAEEVEGLSPGASALLAGAGTPEALGETSYGEDPILVAVAGGSVCAIDEAPSNGGAFCGAPGEALEGRLVSAGFCRPGLDEGEARLFGLMPDGVEAVTIEGTELEEEVPVLDNAYVADVPAESVTISAENAAQLGATLPLEEGAEASGSCVQAH